MRNTVKGAESAMRSMEWLPTLTVALDAAGVFPTMKRLLYGPTIATTIAPSTKVVAAVVAVPAETAVDQVNLLQQQMHVVAVVVDTVVAWAESFAAFSRVQVRVDAVVDVVIVLDTRLVALPVDVTQVAVQQRWQRPLPIAADAIRVVEADAIKVVAAVVAAS